MDEQLLTAKELSDYLQIARRTLENHMKLPNYPTRHIGGSIRFKKDEILQWYEQNSEKKWFRKLKYKGGIEHENIKTE